MKCHPRAKPLSHTHEVFLRVKPPLRTHELIPARKTPLAGLSRVLSHTAKRKTYDYKQNNGERQGDFGRGFDGEFGRELGRKISGELLLSLFLLVSLRPLHLLPSVFFLSLLKPSS